MSQGYPLTKLFASTEEKESPLHGKGIFATSSIKQCGEYSIIPTDPQVIDMLEKDGLFNSAMMPNWKELLPFMLLSAGEEDEDDENEDTNKDNGDFAEHLQKFRQGFDTFIQEEKAKANVSNTTDYHTSLERAADGCGVDFAVKVLQEIAEGDELLRDYGKEWLAIKYFHLKSTLLHYVESVQGDDYEGKLILSIDTKLLNSSMWEFKKKVIDDDGADTNYELGQYLSMREGKEMIVLSPDDMNSLSNIIGMCAVQYLDTEDDRGFGDCWKDNLDHLRSHFPREIVHPASYSSFETETKKKSAKRSKKRKKPPEVKVMKLKHGELDVFKMKE